MPRDLEVWAVSDDGEYVLLAASEDANRPTHQVRIDARLEAAVRGELDDDDDDRRESELSPKEIQARLRAGATVEEVAKVARVALPRIQRYAGPVISERERIIDQARAAVVQRPRGIPGEIALGRMVERRLAETVGLRPETVVWSTRRRDDGAWVVALDYTAKGGSRTAQWLWQPGGRELTSINALGTRLGADDVPTPKRKRSVAAPAPTRAVAPTPTRAVAPARPAAVKRSAKKAAKPVAGPTSKVPARAARTAKTAKAAPAKRARAAAPTRAEVAPVKRRVNKALEAKRAQRRAAPPAPAPVVEPTTARANGRAAVPSWDDVLLGVSPPAARGRRRS